MFRPSKTTNRLRLSRSIVYRLSVPKLGGVISCDVIYLRRKSERVKRCVVLFVDPVVLDVVTLLIITIDPMTGRYAAVCRSSVHVKKQKEPARIL